MLKKTIKILVYLLISYGIYYAIKLYIVYTIALTGANECNFGEIEELKSRKPSNLEVEQFMHKKFSCLKEKQNPIQTFFYPVPENWINPPPNSVTYHDL
jgi:hypothetical protein